VLERSEPDSYEIAGLNELGALHSCASDFNFSAVDRDRGESARFEKPRGPEPFIEADLGPRIFH
jgi:hypothetical protein